MTAAQVSTCRDSAELDSPVIYEYSESTQHQLGYNQHDAAVKKSIAMRAPVLIRRVFAAFVFDESGRELATTAKVLPQRAFCCSAAALYVCFSPSTEGASPVYNAIMLFEHVEQDGVALGGSPTPKGKENKYRSDGLDEAAAST